MELRRKQPPLRPKPRISSSVGWRLMQSGHRGMLQTPILNDKQSVYIKCKCKLEGVLRCLKVFFSLKRANFRPNQSPGLTNNSSSDRKSYTSERYGNPTRNLRDWNPTRYHCANPPSAIPRPQYIRVSII
jgi:hypothetical protein